jgi:hypothetical protein
MSGRLALRPPSMVRAFFLLFVPLALLTACHECSTETCTDYAKVVIATTDGTWVDGDYSLTLEADDAVYSCTFTTPDDMPDETGTWKRMACTPTIDAFLVPVCESYAIGTNPGESCSPLPGKFYLDARAPGTPKAVHYVLTRGDETLVDHTMNVPLYGTVQPNGSDCSPTCHQYGGMFTIP